MLPDILKNVYQSIEEKQENKIEHNPKRFFCIISRMLKF